MGRAEFKIKGTLGNPRAVFEHATKFRDKSFPVHFRWRGPLGRRVQACPVIGDLFPCGEPDPVVFREMFQGAFQCHCAPRTPNETTVQADRKHLGRTFGPLGIEHVKAILEIALKLITVRVSRLNRKAHVVAVHRVRHDQLVLTASPHPVGQIICIAVGDIGEIALLGGKVHSVHGAASGVPAARGLPHHFGMKADCLADLGALFLRLHILVFYPLQTMAGNLPARLLHRLELLGRPHKSGCYTINSNWRVFEQFVNTPEPGAAAVFIDRFHVPMALTLPGSGPGDFR